jgi:hypothetical protein
MDFHYINMMLVAYMFILIVNETDYILRLSVLDHLLHKCDLVDKTVIASIMVEGR